MKVFGFAGYSGSGKTTLIERVLPGLIAHGLRVSVIKHTHHDVDLDRPGKDSYRHRRAIRRRQTRSRTSTSTTSNTSPN